MSAAERAQELAEKFSKVRYVFPPAEVTARGFTVEAFQRVSEIVEKEIARFTMANLPELIEQALLAERRLAMEDAAETCDYYAINSRNARHLAGLFREYATKLATPRGGE